MFATDKVLYTGQAIGIIVAGEIILKILPFVLFVAKIFLDTQENADRAAKMVTVQYSSESKPILTIADAIKADSLYPYPGEGNVLMVGDANGVLIMYYICQPINYVCISVLSLGIVLSLQQDVIKYHSNLN